MTGTIFTSPSSSSSSGSKSAEVEGMTMGSGSSCKADSTSNSSISSSCPSWWPRLSIDFGSWKISFGRGKTRFASGGFGLLLDSPPFCDCHKESSMASTEEHGEDAGETWMMFGEESIGSPRETRPESRRSSSCSNRWNRSCTGSNDSWREACASSRWESKQIEIEWEAKEKQDMTCFTESEQWLPTCRSMRGGTWFDGDDMFEAIHQTGNPKVKKLKNWFQNLVDWEGLENPVSCHHGLVLLAIDHWKLFTLVKLLRILVDGWMHLQFYQQLSVLELLIFQIRNYFLTQVKDQFFCECNHKVKLLSFVKPQFFWENLDLYL